MKLADLGIAKAIERTEITGTGTVLGTPAYMAPEQLEGRKISPAVDTYALATMAFEMLTGRKARKGRTAVEIAHQVVNEDPPDASAENPAIPRPAAEAIRAGMAKDPAQRPRSAVALAERLEQSLGRTAPTERARPARRIERRPPAAAPARQPDTPRAGPPPRRTTRGAGTPRWVLAVLGLFGLALAAVVIGLTSGGGDDDAERAAAPGEKPAKEAKEKKSDEQPIAAEPALDGVPQPQGKGGSAEAEQLHLQGHEALEAGDYDTAIALNTRAIEAFPEGTTWETDMNYAYALYSLGRALRLAGRPDEAIPVLEARAQIPDQQATVQRELDAALADAGE